jgi:myo-inositol-1(or 4)-monophosphatase
MFASLSRRAISGHYGTNAPTVRVEDLRCRPLTTPSIGRASAISAAAAKVAVLALVLKSPKQWRRADPRWSARPISQSTTSCADALPAANFATLALEETEDEQHARREHRLDRRSDRRALYRRPAGRVISAALAVDGRPVLAALFAPVTEELFQHGQRWRDAPAQCRSRRVQRRPRQRQIGGPKRIFEQLAELSVQSTRCWIGSLILRRPDRAPVNSTFRLRRRRQPDWDLAAADLLLHEAGGVLTDMDGRQLLYNRPVPVHGALIAAGRARHLPLLALLREQPAITA